MQLLMESFGMDAAGSSGSGYLPAPNLTSPGCSESVLANLTGFCRTAELSSTNITNIPIWAIQPEVAKYAPYVATIEAFYFLIAFFWNLFILISFGMRRKLLKEPAGVYLFNLALTDLLLAVFVVFQCFITEVAGLFIIGHTDVIRCGICEFLGFMLMFLMTSTLHTLAMLSFDRFFLLMKPLSYRQYFTWRRALAIVILIWIFSFFMTIPPIFGFGEYSFSFPIANCHPQWLGKSYRGLNNFDFIVFLAVEAIIPIGFLTITNIWTYKVITRVLRSRLKRQKSLNSGTPSGQKKTEQAKASQTTHNRQQLQLVKVFGALFVAHILCWTPVMISVVVGLVIGPCHLPPEVLLFGWLLYLTNPVAHPILETFFIKDLRTRVYRAQRSVRRRMSSMRNSFKRTWSQRSFRSKSSDDRRNSESTSTGATDTLPSPFSNKGKSCLTGSAGGDVGGVLDGGGGGGGASPTSSDPPSLLSSDDPLLKMRKVKFNVVEAGFDETLKEEKSSPNGSPGEDMFCSPPKPLVGLSGMEAGLGGGASLENCFGVQSL